MDDQNNTNWAVINLGGKDHLVFPGSRLQVNRLKNNEGDSFEIKDTVAGLPVTLKVVTHLLGKKVRGLKFKNKVRYIRRYGHRQELTNLEVQTVGQAKAASAVKPKAAATPKAKAAPAAKKPAKTAKKNG